MIVMEGKKSISRHCEIFPNKYDNHYFICLLNKNIWSISIYRLKCEKHFCFNFSNN